MKVSEPSLLVLRLLDARAPALRPIIICFLAWLCVSVCVAAAPGGAVASWWIVVLTCETDLSKLAAKSGSCLTGRQRRHVRGCGFLACARCPHKSFTGRLSLHTARELPRLLDLPRRLGIKGCVGARTASG